MVSKQFEDAFGRAGLYEADGFERALANPTGPEGRRRTSIVALPEAGVRILVRPVVHGGGLGRLTGPSLLGLHRPIEELRVAAALVEAKVPVPIPAFAIARRSGPFWNAAVGTVYEEGAIDARSFLSASPSRAELIRAAAAAGHAIRQFHDAGGSHADLHIGNLLLRAGHDPAVVMVADLDRARLRQPVSPARRMRELMRLQRSLVKRGWVGIVGPRGYARFLAAYTAGDRALRTALLARRGREQFRIAVHALRYR